MNMNININIIIIIIVIMITITISYHPFAQVLRASAGVARPAAVRVARGAVGVTAGG